MKSRISIEVDFEHGNIPIIQVLRQSSDDTRDSLIQHFFEVQRQVFRWCRLEYKGESLPGAPGSSSASKYHIIPITAKELPEELKLMQAMVQSENPIKKEIGVNVHDNSDGFRAFLDKSGIPWKPNEHFTTITEEIDLFFLGIGFQKYKLENS